jgi:hypothetical protein
VAIMFIEICNFDEIVTTEGIKLLPWLDSLFRQFDIVCSNFDIEKIEVNNNFYFILLLYSKYINLHLPFYYNKSY